MYGIQMRILCITGYIKRYVIIIHGLNNVLYLFDTQANIYKYRTSENNRKETSKSINLITMFYVAIQVGVIEKREINRKIT